MKNTPSKEVITEAIILRVETYGENDIGVDFITPDFGRLRGVARHGRKSQKRFGTVLDSLNIAKIRYRYKSQDQAFVSLEEASLQPPILFLLSTIAQRAAGFFVADLIRSFVIEKHRDPHLYRLVKESLCKVSSSQTLKKDLFLFEEKFLKNLGYELSLRQCSSCHHDWQGTEDPFYFSFQNALIYCESCRPSGLMIEPILKKDLPFLIARFFEYQLGTSLRSFKFLTSALYSE